MKNKSAKGFVLFLAAMGLLESAAFADNYTITGKIKEYRSWKPIANANVSFVYDGGGEVSAISDEKGNYTIKPELNKSGNLIVKAENYKEYKTSYGATSYDRDYRVNNIDLEFDYFTINGRIFDYVTLEPVKDAEITFVYEYGEGQSDTVKTDETGYYSVKPALGKNGTLQVIKEGYIDKKEKFSAQGAGAVLNNYIYEIRPVNECWTINGKVQENKTWFPIAGAEVGFKYDEGGQVASVTTDALGNFQIKPLINKPGKLIINAKDFKTYIDSFGARSSGRDVYQNSFRMYHNYWTVSGTVVDYKTLEPAVGVSVCWIYDKSSDKTPEVKTDEKGFYQFNIDADRAGAIEFSGDGWVTKKENNGARGSDDFAYWKHDLHKTDETFTLTGKVTDYSTKYYIEGAKVSFTYDDGGEVATETDKLGNYTLYPLINKPGKVIVSKDSYITYKTGSFSRNDTRDKATENSTLYHNYWTQKGKVVDYKTGDGLKDVTLTFYYEDGSQIDCTTDENGYYIITPENNKKGKMSITCEGYTPRREGETYRGSDDFVVYNYDIKKAQDTYTIVGRVFNDKDKKPVSGATVEYTAKDGTKLTATTDEKGDYILKAPLNQDGSFKVTAKGFKEGKDTIGSKSDSRDRVVRDFYLNK